VNSQGLFHRPCAPALILPIKNLKNKQWTFCRCTSHSNEASSSDISSTSAACDLSEEAEALLQLSHQESDEGIVSDQSSSADPDDATKRIKVGQF
jgi:hypothetical protein